VLCTRSVLHGLSLAATFLLLVLSFAMAPAQPRSDRESVCRTIKPLCDTCAQPASQAPSASVTDPAQPHSSERSAWLNPLCYTLSPPEQPPVLGVAPLNHGGAALVFGGRF
jgi:hypothetical protein